MKDNYDTDKGNESFTPLTGNRGPDSNDTHIDGLHKELNNIGSGDHLPPINGHLPAIGARHVEVEEDRFHHGHIKGLLELLPEELSGGEDSIDLDDEESEDFKDDKAPTRKSKKNLNSKLNRQ